MVAETCNQLLLKHSVVLIQIKYLQRLMGSKVRLFKVNWHFIKRGRFISYVSKVFKDVYNVEVFGNPLDCIISRIHYVQLNEPRSRYCQF